MVWSGVCIHIFIGRFVENTHSVMTHFEKFITALESSDAKILSERNYREFCAACHVSPASVDEVAMRELGLGGDELYEKYSGTESRTLR